MALHCPVLLSRRVILLVLIIFLHVLLFVVIFLKRPQHVVLVVLLLVFHFDHVPLVVHHVARAPVDDLFRGAPPGGVVALSVAALHGHLPHHVAGHAAHAAGAGLGGSSGGGRLRGVGGALPPASRGPDCDGTVRCDNMYTHSIGKSR